MRLEPLYRLTFRYHDHWDADAGGDLHRLLIGRGRCEGRVTGSFQGTNASRRRAEGTVEPDYHGVIETDDGAAIIFHLTGYGFPNDRRVSASVRHATSDERYVWLNSVVCAVAGELRDRSVVLDVHEQVWEPLPIRSSA